MVREIEGLGPVKASLVSSEFANMDGAEYYGGKRAIRNIVIKLGLDPDFERYSVFDLRKELYGYLMPKSKAELTFTMRNRFTTDISMQTFKVDIEGVVESLEPGMFSSEPTVDISILCFQPPFVGQKLLEIDSQTVNDFEETVVNYEGTVDTDVLFRLEMFRDMDEGFEIYHRTPSGELKHVYFRNYNLESGDIVTINSKIGEKFVHVLRNGVEASVLYAVTAQSDWLQLEPGENHIRVNVQGDPLPWRISYMNKYGGL